ncbi:hypothetical protein MRX96_059514 [Rhipicephalus microplus]
MASLEPLDPPREQDSSIDAERARHARTGELLRAIPSSSSRATGGAGTIFSFSPPGVTTCGSLPRRHLGRAFRANDRGIRDHVRARSDREWRAFIELCNPSVRLGGIRCDGCSEVLHRSRGTNNATRKNE